MKRNLYFESQTEKINTAHSLKQQIVALGYDPYERFGDLPKFLQNVIMCVNETPVQNS